MVVTEAEVTTAAVETDLAVLVATGSAVTAVAVTVGGQVAFIHKADQAEDHQEDQEVQEAQVVAEYPLAWRRADHHHRTDDGYHHLLGHLRAPSDSDSGCGNCPCGVQ